MHWQIYEQEQKLVELRHSKGPFDRAVRALTTNIREGYEDIILENLPSSESIEQQLWRLHYSFIEEFRARLGKLKAAALAAANVPNKKKAVEQQKFERVGGQYKCFLDEATGFYHGLIAKLGAKHGSPGKISSSSNITGMPLTDFVSLILIFFPLEFRFLFLMKEFLFMIFFYFKFI
jgi:hypothetical protein